MLRIIEKEIIKCLKKKEFIKLTNYFIVLLESYNIDDEVRCHKFWN